MTVNKLREHHCWSFCSGAGGEDASLPGATLSYTDRHAVRETGLDGIIRVGIEDFNPNRKSVKKKKKNLTEQGENLRGALAFIKSTLHNMSTEITLRLCQVGVVRKSVCEHDRGTRAEVQLSSSSLRLGLSSLRDECGLIKVTSRQDTQLLKSCRADVTPEQLTRGTLPRINPICICQERHVKDANTSL